MVRNIYDILEQMRKRPAMYLGRKSISALRAYLDGYQYALWVHNVPDAEIPPLGLLHSWAANKLGWGRTSAGWNSILLEENQGDEEKGLDQFFELLPEFKRVKPIQIGEVVITRTNTDFYQAAPERLYRDEDGPSHPIGQFPDKIYPVEFSANAGWYNYWLKEGKRLRIDYGFGDWAEALQSIENEFGPEIKLTEVPEAQLQQTFEQLIQCADGRNL